ncbi:Uncharacterised protein [uncultured archaeon]|nr:Uncharacterised protein [uncultured archaeon]
MSIWIGQVWFFTAIKVSWENMGIAEIIDQTRNK